MVRRWIISLLSTDYDLRETRKAVTSMLQEHGIEVSAFETPDFPVEPGVHSHDSCIAALERADAAVLIIDKRYGGKYIGERGSGNSITKEEYLKILDLGKPCLVFVCRKTWDELHWYKKQKSQWRDIANKGEGCAEQQEESAGEVGLAPGGGTVLDEFDASYKCDYVEKVDVLLFVDSIQHINNDRGASNWIDLYDDRDSLLRQIEGKLSGLSRFFLEKVVRSQAEIVRARHTTTGMSLSLSDVIAQNYYLEPAYNVESGALADGSSLDEKIGKTLDEGSSIAVFGEAGAGKTTILAKSYLAHVDRFLGNHEYRMPFYLWLKEAGKDYHFNFAAYIEESMERCLGIGVYPFLKLDSIQPIFYLDGFDELAEEMDFDDAKRIMQSDLFSTSMLVTCRARYAHQYMSLAGLMDLYRVRVELGSWSPEQTVKYIDRYCEVKGLDKKISDDLKDAMEQDEAFRMTMDSPLIVTLALWVIENNRLNVLDDLRDRTSIFRLCVEELAARELDRMGKDSALAKELVALWSFVAWRVYSERARGQRVLLEDVLEAFSERFPESRITCSADSLVVLFDCSGEELFGALHEQFQEYLAASAIFEACQNGGDPFPAFLGHVLRPEINRHFTALWNGASAAVKEAVLDRLAAQYYSDLARDDNASIMRRIHTVYYLCRLKSAMSEAMVRDALSKEEHVSVRVSLYFGLAKSGDSESEQEFAQLLLNNEECRKANCGYHLVYYGDMPASDALPFCDTGISRWDNTLQAFIRHFESDVVEYYRLWRIDLITMQHFIKVRASCEPLTAEQLDAIEVRLRLAPFAAAYPEYQKAIEREYDNLRKLVETLA